MNDELVNAKASVVSKLLVIAPYSADRPNRRCGVQTGEIPRQNRSAEDNSGGLLSRVSLLVRWSPTNHLDRVSKAVITSAAFMPVLGVIWAPSTGSFHETLIEATACYIKIRGKSQGPQRYRG